jgi:hypothetical protein
VKNCAARPLALRTMASPKTRPAAFITTSCCATRKMSTSRHFQQRLPCHATCVPPITTRCVSFSFARCGNTALARPKTTDRNSTPRVAERKKESLAFVMIIEFVDLHRRLRHAGQAWLELLFDSGIHPAGWPRCAPPVQSPSLPAALPARGIAPAAPAGAHHKPVRAESC